LQFFIVLIELSKFILIEFEQFNFEQFQFQFT
jgi:hypothetical protein